MTSKTSTVEAQPQPVQNVQQISRDKVRKHLSARNSSIDTCYL